MMMKINKMKWRYIIYEKEVKVPVVLIEVMKKIYRWKKKGFIQIGSNCIFFDLIQIIISQVK